jgi:hypothetical protein
MGPTAPPSVQQGDSLLFDAESSQDLRVPKAVSFMIDAGGILRQEALS